MPTLTIEPEKIFELVDQLDQQKKFEIFERLKPQVITERWNLLFKKIDNKTVKYPITEDEISDEVKRARDEIYADRR
jgi:hypothetical protein